MRYTPTQFMLPDSHYDKAAADYAVGFIESLTHTKGTWAGKPFKLLPWQEQLVRDVFGVLKPNGYRQFNTAYCEIPKKMGKSDNRTAALLRRRRTARGSVRMRSRPPAGIHRV